MPQDNITDINASLETKVTVEELDLDQYFGTPGAEAVVLPSEETEKKTGFFQKQEDGLQFLDAEGQPEDKEVTSGVTSVIAELDAELEQEQEVIEAEKKAGRPKTEKSALVNLLKKKIEDGSMFAFSDYDETQPLEEYLSKLSEKETEELWDANIQHIKETTEETFPTQFLESLPEKLQFALNYVQQGGQDLEGLFGALAQSEHIASLSPEADAATIAERYLYETSFGTEEEIEEVIEGWKKDGTLDKRSTSFKEKLQEIETKKIQETITEQAAKKRQQEEAANTYINNVYEALKPGEVNGLKLNRQTQETLYKGLIKPEYTSVNGKPTNLLGHLLEKYQFVEPNYPLIAEALWLLSDPEAYRGELRKEGGNEKAETIARKLKTEQQSGKSGNIFNNNQEDNNTKRTLGKKLERPAGFFKR